MVSVGDLEAAGFGEQFSTIETAVENHLEGKVSNVAVVAEPFAGRRAFLDYTEGTFGAATGRVSFEELVTGDLPEFPNAEIVLVDNCHYLYTRRIGGFDRLEAFLDHVVTDDALYVTSWNRYAWTYLTAVSGVDGAFPGEIQIPRLDADQVASLVASHHGTPLPMFIEAEDKGRMKSVDLEWHSLELVGDREVAVPYPELNAEYVRSRFAEDATLGREAVVYQLIAKLSGGAPGVATALWDRSVREDRIAPSYVEEVDRPLDIDHDEAYLLEVILTNEEVAYDDLTAICEGMPVAQALQTLLSQGVVTIEDDRVRVRPERLYSTVRHLVRRQLVW